MSNLVVDGRQWLVASQVVVELVVVHDDLVMASSDLPLWT